VYYELYRVEEKLVEANAGESQLWEDRPEGFFVIGDNGFGEEFAIDTSDPNAPVYGISPHHGQFADNVRGGVAVRIADSVDEYAQRIRR
jgi:hypothetical protein